MTLAELEKRKNNMFGEANVGESFSPKGNLPGDHNGFELHARDWYVSSAKWAKVYRIIGKDGIEDYSIADQLATMKERLICNGYIGYETGDAHRNTMLAELETHNFVPEKIEVNCDTDCSALDYAVIYAVTGVQYDSHEVEGSPFNPSQVSCRVSNFDYYMERQLPAAGYMVEVYTIPTDTEAEPLRYYSTLYDSSGIENLTVSVDPENSKYLTSGEYLRRGDLVRTVLPHNYGHSAMWL